MRYYLTMVSIDFPYAGVEIGAPVAADVPADLYAADPPPPVEKEGNTRRIYFWSATNLLCDEQGSIQRLRDSLELQGHFVRGDAIRVAVIRTSG